MSENLNIRLGQLNIGVDCLYDEELNKIDVYTSVNWTADNEEEYENKEKIINDWKYEDELIQAYAWCDISGYNYWVIQQEEENYVSIDVCLKKQPEEYTQAEIRSIASKIEGWDDYFLTQLN